MGNYAWTPVAVRVFAFSVLPVLLAALHVRLDASAKDRLSKVEMYLIYLFMLGVVRERAQRLLRSRLHARCRRRIDRLAEG
ncbi:MAG: hypothetical protein ACRDJT_01960 [Actinomycetota bacterium]